MAMDFSGEYRILAARQDVWAALNDSAVLQACISGCRQLDKVSDTEFTAIVSAKVGPVSATFRGNVVLSDLDPPNGYTLTGQGQGGAAGFARMNAQVSLADDGDETVLRYVARVDIGGKLASIGSRLLQTIAKKNADDFFDAFARHFNGADALAAVSETGERASVDRAPIESSIAPRAAAGRFRSLGSPVPAWMVVFACAVGFGFGYCVGIL